MLLHAQTPCAVCLANPLSSRGARTCLLSLMPWAAHQTLLCTTPAHAHPTVHAHTPSMTAAQVVAADVLSFNQIQHELQARQASVSKSEAREQAAIIQ